MSHSEHHDDNPKITIAYYLGYKSGFRDDASRYPDSLDSEMISSFESGWSDGFAGKQTLISKRVLRLKEMPSAASEQAEPLTSALVKG